MSIEAVLQNLITYLQENRQCGYTTAIQAGADKVKNAIIIVDMQSDDIGKFTKKNEDRIVMSYGSIESIMYSGLRGRHGRPLLIDNGALHRILSGSLEKIKNPKNFDRMIKVIHNKKDKKEKKK